MSLLRAIYVGVAALVALAVWFVVKTRDPNPPLPKEEKSPSRRQHDALIDARNRIRRQMRILANPMRGGDYTGYSAEAMKQLEDALEEVEYELKNPDKI